MLRPHFLFFPPVFPIWARTEPCSVVMLQLIIAANRQCKSFRAGCILLRRHRFTPRSSASIMAPVRLALTRQTGRAKRQKSICVPFFFFYGISRAALETVLYKMDVCCLCCGMGLEFLHVCGRYMGLDARSVRPQM